MKLFTYQDYLIYEELRKTTLKVAEPEGSYNYGQLEINKYHDKIFKELFSNKKEVIGKGGDDMVIENLSRIWDMHYERGVSEGKKEGRRAGIKEIVKRMLKNNMKDEVIKEMTNVNDIELEKIKRELKNSR